jgi:hypothetical protein
MKLKSSEEMKSGWASNKLSEEKCEIGSSIQLRKALRCHTLPAKNF